LSWRIPQQNKMDELIKSVVSLNKIDNNTSEKEAFKNGTGNGVGSNDTLPGYTTKAPAKSNRCTFANSTRYVVVVISTLCLSFVLANALAFNFTVICMERLEKFDPDDASEMLYVNGKSPENRTESVVTVTTQSSQNQKKPMFSLTEQSWLFSAVPAGAILGTIPISYFTSVFGVRKMFIGYGLVSSLATLLLPVAAYQSFFILLIARFLQGFATSTSYVAMGEISAQWSPMNDLGMYLCFISCHFQLAPIMAMPLAGSLCESSMGWPAVYYILGSMSLITFTVFYWFYRDSPREQKNVSHWELKRIEEGKVISQTAQLKKKAKQFRQQPERPPYRAMLSDIAIWGIFVSNIGATFGNQIFWQYGPVYLNKTLGISVKKTGLAAALPYVIAGFMKLIAGPLSDRMTCISQKARVIFFASLSQYTGSLAFFMLVFLSNNGGHPLLTQMCFTAVTAFTGIWTVGVCKSTQMISLQFSHVVFSINTMVSSFIILAIPTLVSAVVTSSSVEEWSRIFLIIGIIQATAQTLFNLTARVEPRSWTKASTEPRSQLTEPLERNNG